MWTQHKNRIDKCLSILYLFIAHKGQEKGFDTEPNQFEEALRQIISQLWPNFKGLTFQNNIVFAIADTMPLHSGTCTSAPIRLPRKPCATFRSFDSSGAGKGSIEAFRSGSSIHSLALTTAITHWAGRRGGSYIYLTPRAVTFLSPHWQLLQKKVSINDI